MTIHRLGPSPARGQHCLSSAAMVHRQPPATCGFGSPDCRREGVSLTVGLKLSLRRTLPLGGGSGLFGGRRRRTRRVIVRTEEDVKTEVIGEVTDETFEDLVLKSPIPVIVDFWAPWCGPCRMIAPLIDELQIDYGDKLKCLKLNTDESPSIATEYGIRSIPTVIVFKDGKKMDTVIGAVAKSTLQATIDRYIDPS